MEFYASTLVRLSDSLILLPQNGAPAGPGGRPPNSYALIGINYSVLVDAPFSWCFEALRAIADRGHPPVALALTHWHVARDGDAFADIERTFGIPVLLDPADQATEGARACGIAFDDPRRNAFLSRSGVSVIPVPGPTPGSVAYRAEAEGGALFAGDCVMGAGPDAPEDEEGLTAPAAVADEVKAQLSALVSDAPVRSFLPYRGRPVVDVPDILARLEALAPEA